MTSARYRQPFSAEYADAIGRAALCFATCEWNVVWSCERLRPGQLHRIVGGELTAGRIARRFLDLTRNMPPSNERETLKSAAAEFARLVELRNAILHGKPCTGPSGDARLSSSTVLEVVDLERAADDFSECSIEVNRLLHGFLASYVPA
jgi:hypothetical protein